MNMKYAILKELPDKDKQEKTRVTIYTEKEIWKRFQEQCALNGVSASSALTAFMVLFITDSLKSQP